MSAGLGGAGIDSPLSGLAVRTVQPSPDCLSVVRGRRRGDMGSTRATSMPCRWDLDLHSAAQSMHELSVAVALVDLACEAAARLRVPRIDAVHVTIGPLAGVVEEALSFSFELAAAGTLVEGATLRLEHVPLIVFCAACSEERIISTPQHLRCPACGAYTPDV